jgi:hypothetical protein
MASPPVPETAKVEWFLQPFTLSGLTLTIARLKIRLYLAAASPGPSALPWEALIDTGAPLSIIPFHIQQKGVHWQPIPGITATWSGQPCDLGRIDVWLDTDQPPYLRGPLPLLAKFPRSDPPGPQVPVLLGLEFFLTHQAELTLLPPPQDGAIRLP